MFRTLFLVCVVALFGCAHQPFARPPIIDMHNVDVAKYHVDLAECKQYGEQVAVGQRVGTGAVAGAVLGAAVGAAVGNSETVQRAAGAGAVVGGARGDADGFRERNRVVHNCLRNRGYVVLN